MKRNDSISCIFTAPQKLKIGLIFDQSFRGLLVEQKLMLSPSFWCDQSHNFKRYELGIDLLSNIDCLKERTACLVCFISSVNGRSKKKLKRSLGRWVPVAGT
jgi:hypothetical protein